MTLHPSATGSPPTQPPDRGGNGSGFEGRLRKLAINVARIDKRVQAMQKEMATKNDVTGLKVWVLGGVLGAIVVSIPIAITFAKAFL